MNDQHRNRLPNPLARNHTLVLSEARLGLLRHRILKRMRRTIIPVFCR
jgi:hypothetical protein